MEAILDAQFQRLEVALNTLIESITSYNPSPQAAQAFVAADDELSKGLEQLAVHQANYARILSLRQTAEALDNQVKSTLGLLAETRKELLDAPVTTFPESSRDVPVDELLTYAKYIGRYTVPPTFRERITEEDVAALERPAPTGLKMSNGGTPAVPETADDSTKDVSAEADGAHNPYFQKLQDELGREKQPELPWEPWPSAETIWVGNLRIIQNQIAQGIDPTTVLSPEEQEAADQKQAQEDEKRKEQESRDAEERKRRESVSRPRPHPTQGQQQESEVDEFNLYDPDEDA